MTGANGFVGSHLCRALIERGHPVRALIRRGADRERVANLPVEWIEGDLSDPSALARGCRGVRWIYHIAGRVKAPSLEEYRKANADGTRAVLEAAARESGNLERFVYMSSMAAGGPSSNGVPRDETAPNNPTTPYGRSKLEGEDFARQYAGSLPVSIVRPPAVYGPGDTEVLGFFEAVSWHIKPIFGDRPSQLSVVHVSDLVEGTILAGTRAEARGETFYIADSQVYDLDTLEEHIQAALGTWALRVRIPRSLLLTIAGGAELVGRIGRFTPRLNRHKAGDFLQVNWACSVAKAERLLGYESRIPFALGARQTVEWYRAHGWL